MPGSAPGLGEQAWGHWVGPASALEKPSSLLRAAAAVGSLYPSGLAAGWHVEVALVFDPGSPRV